MLKNFYMVNNIQLRTKKLDKKNIFKTMVLSATYR